MCAAFLGKITLEEEIHEIHLHGLILFPKTKEKKSSLEFLTLFFILKEMHYLLQHGINFVLFTVQVSTLK